MASNQTVLIVDEDMDSRVAARKALQRAGFGVAGEVGFGTDAVTFATESRPSSILIALEEPVTRPLQTAEVLANLLPETPMIFYATATEPEAVRRAVLFGARDYLVKPLQAAALKESINRALSFEEKRRARQAGELTLPEVRGTVITVAGAKGGIGKSVVAVNLALALHQETKSRVAIVDADTHFGDVATMLDLTPKLTAGDVIRALPTLDRESIYDYLTPVAEGLTLLAAPEGDDLWEAGGPEAAGKIVELLSLSNDFVVVDTSGAMDSYVRTLANVSTVILMVTTGEVSSVRDTKAALTRLKKWDVPFDRIKVVLNRGARAEGFQAEDLAKTLGCEIFWQVPRDKNVSLAVQLGRPIVNGNPKSAAARNLVELAMTIGGNARQPGQKSGGIAWRFGRKTERSVAS